MKIRYSWSPTTGDPAEITILYVEAERVPRKGESVNIRVQISKDEWCTKEGRVLDVWWMVRTNQTSALVILGT